jgi:hypothetical protein
MIRLIAIVSSILKKLAPRAGFEPATCRLTVECSTAELPGNTAWSRREWANTNAFSICQAVFSKNCLRLAIFGRLTISCG